MPCLFIKLCSGYPAVLTAGNHLQFKLRAQASVMIHLSTSPSYIYSSLRSVMISHVQSQIPLVCWPLPYRAQQPYQVLIIPLLYKPVHHVNDVYVTIMELTLLPSPLPFQQYQDYHSHCIGCYITHHIIIAQSFYCTSHKNIIGNIFSLGNHKTTCKHRESEKKEA